MAFVACGSWCFEESITSVTYQVSTKLWLRQRTLALCRAGLMAALGPGVNGDNSRYTTVSKNVPRFFSPFQAIYETVPSTTAFQDSDFVNTEDDFWLQLAVK